MNHNYRLSIDGDSLEVSGTESELNKLRDQLKQKQTIINDKCVVIDSLRQQLADLQHDYEELETREQFLNQKNERLTKEVAAKDQELESISHALKEVETAHETVRKRLESRTLQLQELFKDLTTTKKELDVARAENEQLLHKTEHLTVELEVASSRKRISRDQESQEVNSEELAQIKRELELTESSWKAERQHKERYARENCQLERQMNALMEELRTLKHENHGLLTKYNDLESKLQEEESALSPPPLPPKSHHLHQAVLSSARQQPTQDENRLQFNSVLDLPPDEEMGHHVNSPTSFYYEKRLHSENTSWDQRYDSRIVRPAFKPADTTLKATQPPLVRQQQMENYCVNHRIKKAQFFENSPNTERKLRLERANELARRNMQTKPLHQTSYPLELDTFDTTNFTENQIKRGNVPRPEKTVSRPALANCSNSPRPRKPVKKAEAFIV